MASIKEVMADVTSLVRSATELGISLILAFVVIDVLFPGAIGVVDSIGIIVSQFSEQGLVGLIALLLFLLFFRQQ